MNDTTNMEDLKKQADTFRKELHKQIGARLGLHGNYFDEIKGDTVPEIESSVDELMRKHKTGKYANDEPKQPKKTALQMFTQDRYAVPGRK